MDCWSEEQDIALREARHDGCSYGFIADKFKALGWKRTKNALIGRAARLGLAGPSVLTRALVRRKPKQYAPRVPKRALSLRDAVARLANRRSGPAAAAPLTNSNAAAGAFIGLSILELTDTTCRYPDGEPTTFCGQPPLKGSPYCAKHHTICFCK